MDIKHAALPHVENRTEGWEIERYALNHPANYNWSGLANRKRIWEDCEQIIRLYHDYERDTQSETCHAEE